MSIEEKIREIAEAKFEGFSFVAAWSSIMEESGMKRIRQ